jgi:hypothetical protein
VSDEEEVAEAPAEKKPGGWVENAPRAAHYQVVGTSALSSVGVLPVIAFAYQTLDGQTMTTSMIMTRENLKVWKNNSLRAYDEALRQVLILEQSLAEVSDEDVANDK